MSEALSTFESSSVLRLRCQRCRGHNLVNSGKEPQRMVCTDCNTNYFIVMKMVEVPPEVESPSLEPSIVASSERTDSGS